MAWSWLPAQIAYLTASGALAGARACPSGPSLALLPGTVPPGVTVAGGGAGAGGGAVGTGAGAGAGVEVVPPGPAAPPLEAKAVGTRTAVMPKAKSQLRSSVRTAIPSFVGLRG